MIIPKIQLKAMKKERIKQLLAEQLGIDVSDINEEDTLATDLHMVPSDISDFLRTLEEEGFETTKIDIAEVETVEELIEALTGGEIE